MYSNFIKVIILVAGLSACSKHDDLPELGMGNKLNPTSGVNLAWVDSFYIYPGNTLLKTYVNLDKKPFDEAGVTVSKIWVYKNGEAEAKTWLLPKPGYFLDNVKSGQIMRFQFTVANNAGDQTKKSPIYEIKIP